MARRRKHEHQLGDFWLGKRSGSECWYIQWFSKKTGRVERLSTGTENLDEAQQQLADHFLRKQNLHHAAPDQVTVVAVLKHYYDEHGQHVRSADSIDRTIRTMSTFWPTEPVAAITIKEQERFADAMLARGLSKGTGKRMMRVLGAALRRAYYEGQLATVPAVLKSTYFGEDAERQRILTLDEMGALWDSPMPDHLRVFIVLAINTLGRPEALQELRREQIDLGNRLLHLNPPGRVQTKKHRPTLPITDTLLPWLSMDRDFQVQWKKNQVAAIGSCKTTWRKLRASAGLDDQVIPYTLRHTMAVELRKRSVPEWEARGFMGHRSGGVTERYAKFQPDHLSSAATAIDQYCRELDARTSIPLVLGPVTRQLRASSGNN